MSYRHDSITYYDGFAGHLRCRNMMIIMKMVIFAQTAEKVQ